MAAFNRLRSSSLHTGIDASDLNSRHEFSPVPRRLVSAWMIAAVVAGLACFVAFVWWERRVSSPLVDLALFKNRNFAATKGRAARLGDRSLGHVDPGAASAVTVIRAAADSLADA